jgi:hypothetical protein
MVAGGSTCAWSRSCPCHPLRCLVLADLNAAVCCASLFLVRWLRCCCLLVACRASPACPLRLDAVAFLPCAAPLPPARCASTLPCVCPASRAPSQVNVSDTVVHLPDIVYGVPFTKTITIENVGGVAATWRFVPKPDENHFCKVRAGTGAASARGARGSGCSAREASSASPATLFVKRPLPLPPQLSARSPFFHLGRSLIAVCPAAFPPLRPP